MYARILARSDRRQRNVIARPRRPLEPAYEHDAESSQSTWWMCRNCIPGRRAIRRFVKEGLLTDAAARMLRAGVKGSTLVVEVDPLGDDDIAQRITVAANDFSADLVVMCAHGRRGWRRLVLGSVAERFLRISTLPVLLVPLNSADKKGAPQHEHAGHSRRFAVSGGTVLPYA